MEKIFSFPVEGKLKDETLAVAGVTKCHSRESRGQGPGEEGAEIMHRGTEEWR